MPGRQKPPSLVARYLRLILPSLLIIAVGVGLLELVIDVFSISPIILPRPSRVFHAFIEELPNYPANIAVTLFEAVCGLALGATLAIVLAICITESRLFRQAAMPLIVAQQVLPIIVFAPILLVWFGYGLLSKIIIAAAICFFPITVASIQGLNSIPPAMIEFAKSLGASRWRVLRKIRLPATMPYFLNALKPGVTLASIGAVVGEFLGGDRGLGFLVIEALRFLNLPRMFAVTIVIVIQGLVLFLLIELAGRYFLRWQYLYNEQRG